MGLVSVRPDFHLDRVGAFPEFLLHRNFTGLRVYLEILFIRFFALFSGNKRIRPGALSLFDNLDDLRGRQLLRFLFQLPEFDRRGQAPDV